MSETTPNVGGHPETEAGPDGSFLNPDAGLQDFDAEAHLRVLRHDSDPRMGIVLLLEHTAVLAESMGVNIGWQIHSAVDDYPLDLDKFEEALGWLSATLVDTKLRSEIDVDSLLAELNAPKAPVVTGIIVDPTIDVDSSSKGGTNEDTP